jgi:hypothetical protein
MLGLLSQVNRYLLIIATMLENNLINHEKDYLEILFINHLDKIYAAKCMLVSELPQDPE